jgi:redox-sensitive bicupin YhaK (pirin superfamily)
MDVRPHPHINLATVTWLFEGAIDHRDSLGTLLDDPPRTGQPDDCRKRHRPFGAQPAARSAPTGRSSTAMQTWLALPDGMRRSIRHSKRSETLPLHRGTPTAPLA